MTAYNNLGLPSQQAGIALSIAATNDPDEPPVGGSACGHWGTCSMMVWPDPEDCNVGTALAQELMIWFYSRSVPTVLSTVSIASLEELGPYTVDYTAADAWPSSVFSSVSSGSFAINSKARFDPVVPTVDIDFTLIEDIGNPISI